MDWILPDINFYLLSPEIVILAFALLILILDPLLSRKTKVLSAHLGWIGIVLAFVFVVKLWNVNQTSFNEMFILDNFACFFKFIFFISSLLVIFASINYLKQENVFHGEYFCLILFATLGMMLMVSSLNLIVIFLGMEIMSLSLYVLAGFRRYDLKSNESSIKYFLIGAFASGFLLYGIALVYGSTSSTNLAQILLNISHSGFKSSYMVWMGMGLIIVGFGFKIASVPFHMWAPDVYQGAPTPITAFISAGPKAAGFAALLRVLLFAFAKYQLDWSVILWVLAALSMTIGNVIALSQNNIKRLLAYSSIAHAGYVLVALVGGGEQGQSSAMFYLLVYIFMNIGAFTIATAMGEKNTDLDNYSGLVTRNPALGVIMAVFLLSLAGFPPFAGFLAKFYVFSAAVKSGYMGLTIIAVLNSFVAVYYYLRVVVIMFMRPSQVELKPVSLPFFVSLTLFLTLLGTLWLGIFPQAFLALAKSSFLIVF
ncbi:MAG: NADH-quinone oxidoreductase subunit N [Candidatus Zixiibacteriota bacterium]